MVRLSLFGRPSWEDRAEAIRPSKLCFDTLQEFERQCFGPKSYFLCWDMETASHQVPSLGDDEIEPVLPAAELPSGELPG